MIAGRPQPSRRPLLGVALALLGACSDHATRAHRADWVFPVRVACLAADLRSAWAPPKPFRLFFPFVSGDLYGAPTTGDYLEPRIAGGRFELDLNRAHDALLQSLEPTDLGLSWMRLSPAAARLARLVPEALEANGIEPVGQTRLLDADSGERLMLLYFDRAARLSGEHAANGREARFDVRASGAGFVWVGLESIGSSEIYRAVPPPRRLVLAIIPPEQDGRPPGGSPHP